MDTNIDKGNFIHFATTHLLKAYPEKDMGWAVKQWERVFNNTDDILTLDQVKELLTAEFDIFFEEQVSE